MPTVSNRRKVVVGLATVLAAGGVAVGSGATFTTVSHNSLSGVTAGNLKQVNSKADAAVFNLGNIKPGDSVTGSVTITNSGTLKQKLTLSQGDVADTFTPGDLQMVVTDTTDARTVYSGSFGSLGSKALLASDTGTEWAVGEKHTYSFVVTLVQSAGNENQDKSADATFTWSGVQTAGTATDQSVAAPATR